MRRVGAHSVVYAVASVTNVLAGLLSVAVLTRFLGPHQYGELAVLMVTASLMTLVYNAGSLQGTFSVVYGTVADDGDADGEQPSGTVRASDPQRALATGLALTAAVGCAGTVLSTSFAAQIAGLLLHDRDADQLIVWTAAGAAGASVWRLGANALRLERRPGAYLVATAAQHLLGISIALPLLIAGRGMEGAVAGVAIGNAIAVLLVALLLRRSLRLALSWSDALNILRRGRALVPVVAAFQTIQLADVLLLSRFVPAPQVGLYRVASRIGALVSHCTSSFHMAWGPIRRDALHLAADVERGRGKVAARIATYFSLMAFGAVLAAGLFADELTRIAAPRYADAAPLIPLTAFGFALHGFYVLAYRVVDFRMKRHWFVVLSVVNALTFLLSSLFWIPLLGIYGAPAAVICGWSVGIVVLVVRGQRSESPVPYEYGRMVTGLVTAGILFAIAKSIPAEPGLVRVGVGVASLAGYGIGLVALRVVEPRDVREAGRLIYAWGRRTAAGSERLRLDAADFRLVELLLRRRAPTAAVARDLGLSVEEVQRRLVTALRRSTGADARSRRSDEQLGAYLLLSGADRDSASRAMVDAGVDPVEADVLEGIAKRIRRQSDRHWRAQAPLDATLSAGRSGRTPQPGAHAPLPK